MFDDAGRLTALCSRGQVWEFEPAGAGGALILETDGVQRLGVPDRLCRSEPGTDGESVRFVFEGVRFEDGSESVSGRIEVAWRLADGLLLGSMSATAVDTDGPWRLSSLVFPCVSVGWEDPEATALVLPRELGKLVPRAASCLFADRTSIALSGAQFQCLAWIEGDRGLYLDTRDREGWLRTFCLERNGEQAVRIQVRHLVPGDGASAGAFRLPYEAALGGTTGHWYDVARVYRKWALGQHWARRGPADRRESRFAEIACWVWNRGASARVCPPVAELAERIGHPVGLDWYWWHKHPYDTGYPDYFPPREGEACFKRVVRDLQRHNVFVQVYTNGVAWDMDGPMWRDGGPACAVIRENGEVLAHAFNRFMGHRLAYVCGAAPGWPDILSGVVRDARALGLDGLYIDMIAIAGGVHSCHSPHHPHAPGGGSYGIQGFRRTLERLRAENPGFPLTSESVQEQFLDLLEGGIVLSNSAERFAGYSEFGGCPVEPVPLFNAVYHGRTVCFGNYALLDGVPPFDDLWPPEFRPDPARERDWAALCPDQFAFEVARTVVFGCQPMVCNLTAEHLRDPRFEADIDFLVRLSRTFAEQRKFLLWGDMLEPGRLVGERRAVKFLRRYIFTKPGEETVIEREYPAVLHSAWRAEDGEAAVLLVNTTRDPAAFAYQPPPGWAAPAAGCGELCLDEGQLTGVLPARAIRLVPLRARETCSTADEHR